MQLAQTHASVRWAPTVWGCAVVGRIPSRTRVQLVCTERKGQRAVLYRRRRGGYRAPKREGMQEDERGGKDLRGTKETRMSKSKY
jgi:hypothetical protein